MAPGLGPPRDGRLAVDSLGCSLRRPQAGGGRTVAPRSPADPPVPSSAGSIPYLRPSAGLDHGPKTTLPAGHGPRSTVAGHPRRRILASYTRVANDGARSKCDSVALVGSL